MQVSGLVFSISDRIAKKKKKMGKKKKETNKVVLIASKWNNID